MKPNPKYLIPRTSYLFHFWLPQRLIYGQASEQPHPFDANELKSLQEGTEEIADSAQAQEFLLRNLEEAVKALRKQLQDIYINQQDRNPEIRKYTESGKMNALTWHLQNQQNLALFESQIQADIDRELNQTDAEYNQEQLDFVRETAQKIAKLFGYQEQITSVADGSEETVHVNQFGVLVDPNQPRQTQKIDLLDQQHVDPNLATLFTAIDSVSADWPGWIEYNQVSGLETTLKKELINIFSTAEGKAVLEQNLQVYTGLIAQFLTANAGNWEWGGLDDEKISQLLTQIRSDVDKKAEQIQLENFKTEFAEYQQFFNNILPFLDQIANEVPDVQQLAELDLNTIQKANIAAVETRCDETFNALFAKLNARAAKLVVNNEQHKEKLQTAPGNLLQRLEAIQELPANYETDQMLNLAEETDKLATEIATFLAAPAAPQAAPEGQEHTEFNKQLAGILTELNNKTQSAKEAATKIGTMIAVMKKQPDFQGKQDILIIATSIQTMLNQATSDQETIAKLEESNQQLTQQITVLQGCLPSTGPTSGEPHGSGHPHEHTETLPKDPIQAALAEALTKPPTTLTNAKGTYIVTTNTSPYINFRDLKTGADIGDIPKGTDVEVIADEGFPALKWTFVKVKYKDKEGLVALSLLQRKPAAQPDPSVQTAPQTTTPESIESDEKALSNRYSENLLPRITKNPGLSEAEQTAYLEEFKTLQNNLQQAEAKILAFRIFRGLPIYNTIADLQPATEQMNTFEAQITQKEIELLSQEATYKEYERELGEVNSITKTADGKIKIEFDWEGIGQNDNATVYIKHVGTPPSRTIKVELYSTHLDKQEPEKGVIASNSSNSVSDVIDFLKRAKDSHKESRAGKPADLHKQGVPPESHRQELDPKYRYQGLDLYDQNIEEVINALKIFREDTKTNPAAIRIFAQPEEKSSQTPQHYAFELTKKADGSLLLVDTTHKGLREYRVADATLSKNLTNDQLYAALKGFGEQIHQNDLAKGVNKILYEYGFNEKTEALWVHLKDQPYSVLKDFAERVKGVRNNTERVHALHASRLKTLPRGTQYEKYNLELQQKNIRPLPKNTPDFSKEIRIYEKFALALERVRELHPDIYTGTETVHYVVINAMRYFDKI